LFFLKQLTPERELHTEDMRTPQGTSIMDTFDTDIFITFGRPYTKGLTAGELIEKLKDCISLRNKKLRSRYEGFVPDAPLWGNILEDSSYRVPIFDLHQSDSNIIFDTGEWSFDDNDRFRF
tara:strand:+ start:1009 stop:1371 length:363 start_codon:yes stop_codon:yes gene_type:complete